ncbi:hypothetical protein M501DRAFT_1011024 [Patellaria atrata CBS 101060]|uniref:DUF1989 domain-containing protein n=1 Tax=Patellaria atrata CBS 101060 TaxID=1346257 RepID=A0A9P4SAX8_9PEZI|nr:hypothetical protein M501DRAFT_1011024 [Patellaria atrata CBS 101060]
MPLSARLFHNVTSSVFRTVQGSSTATEVIYSFEIKIGTRFRVVDLHGEQIVDFMAWAHLPSPDSAHTNLTEKVSMAYTRYHLSEVTPAIGEYLYTNADRPLLRITKNTVRVHDMTYMSCYPKLYTDMGYKNHRSCAQNIFEVMEKYGVKSTIEIAVVDPFNIFQNTPNYSLKRLRSSKPGDFIEFEALDDTICAVSSCPYDINGVNGGTITDIAVEIYP